LQKGSFCDRGPADTQLPEAKHALALVEEAIAAVSSPPAQKLLLIGRAL